MKKTLNLKLNRSLLGLAPAFLHSPLSSGSPWSSVVPDLSDTSSSLVLSSHPLVSGHCSVTETQILRYPLPMTSFRQKLQQLRAILGSIRPKNARGHLPASISRLKFLMSTQHMYGSCTGHRDFRCIVSEIKHIIDMPKSSHKVPMSTSIPKPWLSCCLTSQTPLILNTTIKLTFLKHCFMGHITLLHLWHLPVPPSSITCSLYSPASLFLCAWLFTNQHICLYNPNLNQLTRRCTTCSDHWHLLPSFLKA